MTGWQTTYAWLQNGGDHGNLLEALGRELVVLCPLCLRPFSRSDAEKGRLTLEDVPPRSVGGRARTLTCKDCNNGAGAMLDSHLARQVAATASLSGRGTEAVRAEVSTARARAAVNMKVGEGTVDIEFLPQHSEPSSLERVTAELKKPDAAFQVTVRCGYRKNIPGLSIYRAGFLAFSYLGYGWALHPDVRPARDLILAKSTEVAAPVFIQEAALPGEVGLAAALGTWLGVVSIVKVREKTTAVLLPLPAVGLEYRVDRRFREADFKFFDAGCERNPPYQNLAELLGAVGRGGL